MNSPSCRSQKPERSSCAVRNSIDFNAKLIPISQAVCSKRTLNFSPLTVRDIKLPPSKTVSERGLHPSHMPLSQTGLQSSHRLCAGRACQSDVTGRWRDTLACCPQLWPTKTSAGRQVTLGLGTMTSRGVCSATENGYTYHHNNVETNVPGPYSRKIGVYLDYKAAILRFYHVSDQMGLLFKVQTTFVQLFVMFFPKSVPHKREQLVNR